jgi:hypothetical protein
MAESSSGRGVVRLLRELQPGWWVLRGYLAVLAATVLLSDYPGIGTARFRDNLPLPVHEVAMVAGMLTVAVVAVMSLYLGRTGRRNATARKISIALNMAVGIGLLGAFGGWGSSGAAYAYEDAGSGVDVSYLQHADGTAIANICPYSTDGKLLSGVLLFDQRGRAITNTADYGVYQLPTPIYPTTPTIKNVYPRALAIDEVEPGAFGPVSCPPSIAAQPHIPTSPAPGVPSSP